MALRLKYGSDFKDHWLSAGDRKKAERLSEAREKAGDAFFEHVKAISPRDWSRNVPMCWVLMDLTYEDAVRPVGEALSVAPPLGYGSTVPMT